MPGQVVADFTASPTEGYRQLTVSFTNLSQGDIVTYLWYFGDGQESGQKDPVHIYKKKGTYSVILKVFGRNDTQDSKAKDSYITVKSRCIFIQSLDNSEAVDTYGCSETSCSTIVMGHIWHRCIIAMQRN